MKQTGKSTVAVLKCATYETEKIHNKIREGLELIGGIDQFIQKKDKILLKPNLLFPDPPEMATTTHPAVFESVAKVLLDKGAEVVFGDSPAIHTPVKAIKKTGLYEVAEKLGLKMADFENRKKIFHPYGIQNRVFEIASGVIESDGIVSLPKLKTHGLTLMTGAIKNQLGCIPGLMKSGFHAKLEHIEMFSQMLVDLTMLLKPRLYIMDGIMAMEGNGPRRGHPVDLGILLISDDPVALDTVASRIIGLDPQKVIPTVKGNESGLGTMEEIETKGSVITEVQKKFELPRISGNFRTIPPFLRRALKKIFIQQPVVTYKRCTKCHECHKICPTTPKSINIRDDKYPAHNYGICIRCYCCQETCPEGAITIRIKVF